VIYDPTAALSVPGRLILGPTQPALLTGLPLGADGMPTYGGTALGYVSGVVVVPEVEHAYALSESTGLNRAKTYRGGEQSALVFTLVQYDPQVNDQAWASSGASAGGYSGANTLSLPAQGRSLQPGLVPPSLPLLFAPDNVEHPAVLLYAPAWMLQSAQKLAFLMQRPLESVLVVVAGVDAAGHDLAIGRLEDLSLT
jgi:hypothetical protein